METKDQQNNVKTIAPQNEIDTEQKMLEFIYKLIREKHELQQVCLEVYRGLRQTDKMSLVEFHWEAELARVLFEAEIFLHCNRDAPTEEE